MSTIQLLTPKPASITRITRELQASPWPEKSEAALGSSKEAELTLDTLQRDALEAKCIVDRTIPRPVDFAWKAIQPISEYLVYNLLISTDSTFENPLILKDITEPCSSVFNLYIGTKYFWKVVARDRDSVFAVSPVWFFTTHPSPPRWVGVPGITNVRDMGGWRLGENKSVRQGLIYRSSEMNGHINITDEGRMILIEELGIRTDLDLRGPKEEPKAVLDQSLVKWINVPISPYEHIVADDCVEGYRQVFSIIADPSAYPILFHCWGGCDRGGTVAFLLHALLGVDKDSLFCDYELSSLFKWGERSHLSDWFQSLLSALRPFGVRKNDFGVQVENYLRSIGVTTEEITSIRRQLIEEIDR